MISSLIIGARGRPHDVSDPAAERSPHDAVQRYLPALQRYAQRRLGDCDGVHDVVADTFAAAFGRWTHRPRGAATGDHDPLRAWLFAIARRKVIDAHAQRRRRREDSLTESSAMVPGPETALVDADEACRLRALIDTLPELQRETLLLKYADNLSLIEIGAILGKSPDAVSSLLQRARAALRAHGPHFFADYEETNQ